MERYSIHPVDAVVVKNGNDTEKSIKMMLCSNGCATTPEQRKEAELLVRLLNWYDSIDKKLLDIQVTGLRELEDEVDEVSSANVSGVADCLSDLLIIVEDLRTQENLNHKDNIENILLDRITSIGMGIPENFEDVVQYVFEDVMETSNYPNYSDGDVMIGFRRWIESKV